MRTPFRNISRSQAISKLPRRPDYARELDDFLAGDLWRSGDGWIGELPATEVAKVAMARGIVGENVLAEITGRAVGAVIGKEPRWKLVDAAEPRRPHRRAGPPQLPSLAADPTDPPALSTSDPPANVTANTAENAEAAARLEIEDALTSWWDRRNLIAVLQQAAWHKASEGRGALYACIPPGLRDEQGRIPRCATLAEALEYIYVDARSPATAGVHIDRRSRLELGIVADVDERGRATADVSYLDEQKQTVLEVLPPPEDAEPWVLDLGGYLFVHDSRCRPILTRQVVQDQKALTLTLSQLMRNVNLAGHRQIDYINAKPPGTWVPAQAGEHGAVRQADGTWARFVPAAMPSGPGVRNFIQGNEVYNDAGELVGYTNPNVSTVEPTDVSHFERTYTIFRTSALRQCNQAHVLGADAAQSGISREQARADFETSLGPLKTAMDDAGRWLLTVVLRIAASLMQQPEAFHDLRAEFDCVVNTGPLSPEEQNQIRANVKEKLISRERAMSLLGVDDVAAELERIDTETVIRQARAPQMTPEDEDEEDIEEEDEEEA